MKYYRGINIEIPKDYVKIAEGIMKGLKPPQTSLSVFCTGIVCKVLEEATKRKWIPEPKEEIKISWFKKLINKIFRRIK